MKLKINKKGEIPLSKFKNIVDIEKVKYYRFIKLKAPRIGFKLVFYDAKKKRLPIKQQENK